MKLLTFWRSFFRPAPLMAQQTKTAQPPAPDAIPAATSSQAEKLRRAERRDALSSALRETMLRTGILSSRYKARFLKISKHTEQYVILCELDARELDTGHETLNQLEISLQQLLLERMPLVHAQIYWRVDGHAAKPAPSPAMRPDFALTQPMRHRD